jgi:type I restriction enzyme S subunit
MSQFIEMFGGGNWPQKTLGEVGSFTRGGGFQKSDFVEHGIPCIHYGQIHTKFGPFITSHITEISSDLESKTKFASKGDLVIAITSEDTEGSCKSTAWLGDYSVAVGGHAAIYKHSMNPLYMSFFFKSTLFNHAKIEYVHGTKVFEIKPDDIAKILVPCPPMNLQNQFSAIAEQADKSGFDGFKSQFIEMFGDPMVNDKQWSEYSCISEITQIVLGGTPNSKEPSYWDGDIRWITPAEMTDQSYYIFDTVRHITDEGRKVANLTVLPEGTVLFSTRAPIGKVAIVGKEMCCNQGFKNFICSEKLNNVFLYYTLKLKKDYLCSLGTGTTFKELSKRTVESLKIAVPPIELQNQFETIYNQADKSGFELRKSIDAIDAVIKSLINS